MIERVLVVDDEPDMLKLIGMILRETELQIVTTPPGCKLENK